MGSILLLSGQAWLIPIPALQLSISNFISFLSSSGISPSFSSISILSHFRCKNLFFSNIICLSVRAFFMSNFGICLFNSDFICGLLYSDFREALFFCGVKIRLLPPSIRGEGGGNFSSLGLY